MVSELAPIRERAQLLSDEPERVLDALADGANAARTIARETMAEVKQHMGMDPLRAPIA